MPIVWAAFVVVGLGFHFSPFLLGIWFRSIVKKNKVDSKKKFKHYRQCTLLTKTYEVHDYWKYIASATQTFSSSNLEWVNLCDLTSLTDYEITATLKSTQNKGFSLSAHQNNNNDNTYVVRNGVDGSSNEGINVILSSGVAESHYPSPNIPYSANTDLNVKITKQNGVCTMEIGNYSSAINNPPNIQYIGVDSWNIAKTLTITDFIVKPL